MKTQFLARDHYTIVEVTPGRYRVTVDTQRKNWWRAQWIKYPVKRFRSVIEAHMFAAYEAAYWERNRHCPRQIHPRPTASLVNK